MTGKREMVNVTEGKIIGKFLGQMVVAGAANVGATIMGLNNITGGLKMVGSGMREKKIGRIFGGMFAGASGVACLIGAAVVGPRAFDSIMEEADAQLRELAENEDSDDESNDFEDGIDPLDFQH